MAASTSPLHPSPRTALWVSPVSDLAGVARHIIDAARVGIPGWELHVACPEGALADRLRQMGTAVHTIDIEQPWPRVVLDLRAIIKHAQAEVVHSHLAKADFLCAMAAFNLKSFLVSTEHGIPMDPLVYHSNPLIARLRQAAHHLRIRRFSHLIAVSEATSMMMRQLWRPTAPITVVLNGVDRPSNQPPRREGLRIASLSRLAPEKNLDITIAAFAKVAQEHPGASLTIAGEGPQRVHLEALTTKLGLAASVNFPGFVDPATTLAAHDVLVQPSRSENLSYTLLDAVALGMGVVATPVGGNPEFLPPHCLVEHSDVDAIAATIVDQGFHIEKRPVLPHAIPTVAGMCLQIALIYDEIRD